MEDINKFFSTALKAIFERARRGAKAQVARDAGIYASQLNDMITTRRGTDESKRRAVAAALGWNYEELLLMGRCIVEGRDYVPPKDTNLSVNMDDFLLVPFYRDMRLAAGVGGTIPLPEEQGTPVIIYRPRLGARAKHDLRAFMVGGDSMEPTIVEKGIVVVDLDDKTLINNKIYMLYQPDGFDDYFAIKRVQKIKGGGIAIISDNTAYPPQVSDLAWSSLVAGRVIWGWREFE